MRGRPHAAERHRRESGRAPRRVGRADTRAAPAVTDVRSGHCLTYGQLGREAERVAAFLTAQGVEPGQRIALLAPNDLGLPARGVRPPGRRRVPGPARHQPHAGGDRGDRAGRSQVNGCLAWPKADRSPEAAGARRLCGRRVRRVHVPVDRPRRAKAPTAFGALNPAFIRFTSGTTASSKGVVLSHEATAARVEASDRVLRVQRRGPHPLGAAARLSLRGHDRRLRAGRRAHPAVPRHASRRPSSSRSGDSGASVLYASPLHFERMSNLGPSGPLGSIRLGAVDQRADRAGGDGALRVASTVFRSARPTGSSRRVCRASTAAPRVCRPPRSVAPCPATRSPCSRTTGAAPAVRGRRARSACGATASSPRTTRPGVLREQVTRDGWFLTGDIGSLESAGALYLEGPQEGRHLRGGAQVLPRGGRGLHQRVPGDQGIARVRRAARSPGPGAVRGDRRSTPPAATWTR